MCKEIAEPESRTEHSNRRYRKNLWCFLLLALIFTGILLFVQPDSEGESVPLNGILFSHDSGVYPQRVLTLSLTAPEGYTIAYTTDGTVPLLKNDSGRSSLRIRLRKGTEGYLIGHADLQIIPDYKDAHLLDDPSLPAGRIITAALVDKSGSVGMPESKVFFIGTEFDKLFPGALVLSVITDPENLLDYGTGILATGAVYDAWKRTEEAEQAIARQRNWEFETNSTQRGREWERPCTVQIYDGSRNPVLEENAGIRIQGQFGRTMNQKSFNLYFRKEYGERYLEYELFPGTDRYRSFTISAGGNNAERIKFKEALLEELVQDRGILEARSRPAVLFLNGEYWGPYLLKEKISDQMISDRCGVDKDQVIVMKNGELEVGEDGDRNLYENLMSFAEEDLADPDNWDRFCGVMDVRSLAETCAIQVYLGNVDWSEERNCVLWRTRDTSFNGGRWQYILYDIEYSTWIYAMERTAPYTDHYHMLLENYPLFKAADRNDQFHGMFLDAIRQVGSVNYSPERVDSAFRTLAAVWEPLMKYYYKRYGDTSDLYIYETENMMNFFSGRYSSIIPIVEEDR